MLGIQIRIRLSLDLFGRIRILQEAIAHLTVALKQPIFIQKKRVHEPYFRPNLLLHSLISTIISRHFPFQSYLFILFLQRPGVEIDDKI
jgi:hypothetical protein